MKISLFSQSLFALPLMEAIETTARIGFPAIELACTKPHFDLETAIKEPKRVAEQIQKTGLKVSALSLFNNFTDRSCLNAQVEGAETYIRLAPLFDTKILKMTPGPPGSAKATEEHWRCLAIALDRLVPVAEEVGVRLAFETHMRQLTDTLAGSKRLLEMAKSNVVGLTVDFSNLTFAGENMFGSLTNAFGLWFTSFTNAPSPPFPIPQPPLKKGGIKGVGGISIGLWFASPLKQASAPAVLPLDAFGLQSEVISTLEGRIYNTHIKNGTIDKDGGWHFHALDTGLTDYLEVLSLLREINYTGYLTIECLGPDANEKPVETAKRDLDILRRYLEQVEH